MLSTPPRDSAKTNSLSPETNLGREGMVGGEWRGWWEGRRGVARRGVEGEREVRKGEWAEEGEGGRGRERGGEGERGGGRGEGGAGSVAAARGL
jgi:hypothetical protein